MAWDNISHESIMRKHRAIYFFLMQTEVKRVSSEKLFYMMQKTGFLMVIANTESQSLGNTVDTKKGKLCISK